MLSSSSPSSSSSLSIPKSKLTTAFFILVFSVLIRTILCHVNLNFQACKPKTCGNGPNITYPFYIHDKQNRFCGFHGFRLVCASNDFPMLNLSNTLYMVDEIFYHNYSFRVSNPNLKIPNSTNCLSPSNNLTPDSRFKLAPNQMEVLLFFDCDLPSLSEEMRENVLGCFEGSRTRWVLGMAEDDAEKLKYAKDNCRGGTMRTMVENMGGGTREALGRGFLLMPLNLTTSDCDACEKSGGRCSFFDVDEYLQVPLARPRA